MRTEAGRPHSKLVALLGPTNTGKTHRAIRRMLEHPTGMLGLPLRLLAREVYDGLTRELGEQRVALVTGEEKRIGARARYWICTVEAMPLTREVDFLAIDEIQLAAHPRRGHVFTDRLLHARGRVETWFLGADTMRPLLRRLLPSAQIESHQRLSTLAARGQSTLGNLPARSAIVAFSVPEVYRIAERVRRRRGGAAVVLGALSPRARNAQVALYEAREVEYLVATDAIGMGLNLGIRHVAFASLRKFDGRDERLLLPAELAQIAGRAGRHLENGSFGTLAPLPALPEGLQRCITDHRFEPVEQLTWRNADLSLHSLPELLESLRAPVKRGYFRRLAAAADSDALERLAADAEVRRRAHGTAVALLWQACQIPNYRRWLPELHAEVVKQVFLQLSSDRNALDPDWLAAALQPLEETSGDIDALTARIAALRTWTYLAHHHAWTHDVEHWAARTRALEDRLSDALHEQLVERFVERRRRAFEFGSREPAPPAAQNEPSNPFGVLGSLRERLFEAPAPLSPERWVEDLVRAPHERFSCDIEGNIYADDQCLGRLTRGVSLVRPEVRANVPELSDGQQLRLSRRLLAWSRDLVHELTWALHDEPEPAWSPAGRGLSYQLGQSLGALAARKAAEQLRALSDSDRTAFEERGVRLGREIIYVRDSFSPRSQRARIALCQAFTPQKAVDRLSLLEGPALAVDVRFSPEWLNLAGFILLGTLWVRADIADRISTSLRRLARRGAFELPLELAGWLTCEHSLLPKLARALGYRANAQGLWHAAARKRGRLRRRKATASP
jgi:ATP-dependent RNA helicase SUPV3L1/SUV3